MNFDSILVLNIFFASIFIKLSEFNFKNGIFRKRCKVYLKILLAGSNNF
jgi:hypothetical protein